MKTILSVVFVLFSITLMAQDKRDTIKPAQSTQSKVKIKEELGLTKEQSKQLKQINQESKQKFDKLKGDSGMSEDQKKEERKKLMKERRDKINNILTPEQQEKFKGMNKKNKKK